MLARFFLPALDFNPEYPFTTGKVREQGMMNHLSGILGGSGPQTVIFPGEPPKRLGLSD